MRKFIIILFLFLFSCQKDFIDTDVIPSFFDKNNQEVVSSQIINFNLPNDGIYYLLFVNTDGELVAREKFTGTEGLNSRTIHVGLLDQQEIYLILYNSNQNKLQEVLLKLNK